nr:hypothetical protein CFP56_62694 [Quercus suber]
MWSLFVTPLRGSSRSKRQPSNCFMSRALGLGFGVQPRAYKPRHGNTFWPLAQDYNVSCCSSLEHVLCSRSTFPGSQGRTAQSHHDAVMVTSAMNACRVMPELNGMRQQRCSMLVTAQDGSRASNAVEGAHGRGVFPVSSGFRWNKIPVT